MIQFILSTAIARWWREKKARPLINTFIMARIWVSDLQNRKSQVFATLKCNMEPENKPLEKQIAFGNHYFQVHL